MDDLSGLVRRTTGSRLREWWVEPVEHAIRTPSTAGLRRVRGTTADGGEWSFFVKTLQSVRHWADLSIVPEPYREDFVAGYPWRAEADLYLADLPLPEGLRMPRLYLVDELGDDRVDLWLEDVRTAEAGWDLDRYRGAARLLGRLAALRPSPRPGLTLRMFVASRVVMGALPFLQAPATWKHPLVAEHADPRLRGDLDRLADRIDELLDAVERLPQTFAHGDACPQNLLVPADGPAALVAIDWAWADPVPVGFDLGQLLVGLAHEGLTEPSELPLIHAAIEPAYLAGLRAEGYSCDPAALRLGYVATLVLRSAFTAVPTELLELEPSPELKELFRRRVGLARFLADLLNTFK